MPLLTDLLIRQTKAPAAGRARALGLEDRRARPAHHPERRADVERLLPQVEGEQRRLTLGPYRPEESTADGLTLGEARRRAGAVRAT